jgi:hypothetical protein
MAAIQICLTITTNDLLKKMLCLFFEHFLNKMSGTVNE